MASVPAVGNAYPQLLQEFVTAYVSGPSRAALRSVEADLLSQVPVSDPVLDLACGDGLVASLAFRRPLDTGCDLSEDQLRKARTRKQYESLTLADARKLPYQSTSFATVICNSSMEHIPHVEQVIEEVGRVLQPGGVFAFTVPGPRFNDWFWLNWICIRLGMPGRGEKFITEFNKRREHLNLFDAGTWKKLMEPAGFADVRAVEYFSFRTTFVFSILEYLWNITVPVPVPGKRGVRVKRINPGGAFLRVLPASARTAIQVRPFQWLERRGPTRKGSHLLVIARKSDAA
jgi:ubiquinone/menaquinone biosynthesis C-methylase UbiE